MDAELRQQVIASPTAGAKHLEILLDALKAGLANPGPHRLFRAGKNPGLFPSRAGASADAALTALTDGLIETVRTEAKGRLVVEWVRVTTAGVAFVHDRDSPKAVLRELKALLGATRAGVPTWMAESREEIAAAVARFDTRADRLLARFDDLAVRVEAALRRAEAGVSDSSPGGIAPWAVLALEFLDRRLAAGAVGPCPLGDLFRAVRGSFPDLTVPEFHQGLGRMNDTRAVRLVPGDEPDPDYALFVGADLCGFADR